MPHFAPRELLTLSSRVISRRTRALGSASSGAWTPEGPEIVAQGEEETAETEEEEDAPEWFDLREIHEKELADDEEERNHAVPDERNTVEPQPGDEKCDGIETPGYGDPGVSVRQCRELAPEKGEKGSVRRATIHEIRAAGQDEARRPEGKGYDNEVH